LSHMKHSTEDTTEQANVGETRNATPRKRGREDPEEGQTEQVTHEEEEPPEHTPEDDEAPENTPEEEETGEQSSNPQIFVLRLFTLPLEVTHKHC